MPLILSGNLASATAGGYDVANSCRFNDDSSDYLNRTPGSDGNRKTFTISLWIKRSTLGNVRLITCHSANNDAGFFELDIDSHSLRVIAWDTNYRVTNRLLRDVGAWYHVCISVDTTQGTANNRIKMYINGVQETSFSTTNNPSEDADTGFNQASTTRIGLASNSTNGPFDGYMAEVVFIDGLALTPTSFGEFDEDSPTIWKPKNVSGLTFGTNGFYLDFEDSSALGNDVSGNNNDFTVNNLTAIDQATDSPTNNFATLNPLDVNPSNTNTFAEGNLQLETNGVGARSTIAVENGQWYCEVKHVENTCWNGIMDMSTIITATTNSVLLYTGGTTLYIDGSNQGSGGYGAAWSANDILMMALDLESGTKKLYFGKNGNWWDTDAFDNANPTTGITLDNNVTYGFHSTSGSGHPVAEWNFGSPPYAISSGNTDGNGYGNFEYAVPSSYFSLCTKNLAEYG